MDSSIESISAEELASRKDTITNFLKFSFASEGKTNFTNGASIFEVTPTFMKQIRSMAISLLGFNVINDADKLKALSDENRWIDICSNIQLQSSNIETKITGTAEEPIPPDDINERSEKITNFLKFSFASEGKTNLTNGESIFTVTPSFMNEIHEMAVLLLGLNPQKNISELIALNSNEKWVDFCKLPAVPTPREKTDD